MVVTTKYGRQHAFAACPDAAGTFPPIILTAKEFDLLYVLMKNAGRILTREFLLERIWGYAVDVSTRTVDVHIRWLREKIENNSEEPKRLITVRGVGYKFEG